MFKITRGRGLQITFVNGYTVSLQFGWGNYSDNRNEMPVPFTSVGCRITDVKCGQNGSITAEGAILAPKTRALVELPGGDTVAGYLTPEQALSLMVKARYMHLGAIGRLWHGRR